MAHARPAAPRARDERGLRRRVLPCLTACGMVWGLISCGGAPRPALPVTPAAITSPDATLPELAAASPVPTVPAIGEIVWTTDTNGLTGAPADDVSRYGPEAPRLVAAAPANDLDAGSRIDATWVYNDTPLEAFTTTLTTERQIDDRWLNFHIERAADVPWPAGIYEVAISLDGTPMSASSVEVLAAE